MAPIWRQRFISARNSELAVNGFPGNLRMAQPIHQPPEVRMTLSRVGGSIPIKTTMTAFGPNAATRPITDPSQ
jgi:hypothetical protein